MPSGAKHILTGRITRFKMSETKSGKDFLSFSIPCEYGKKGEDGKKPCQWFRVNALEHNARSLNAQLQDGDHVVVQVDSITAKAYQDKQGEMRVSLDVWVQDWQVSKLCWRKKDETPKDDFPEAGGEENPDIPF
jgi:single-stranded DNA-binding protein